MNNISSLKVNFLVFSKSPQETSYIFCNITPNGNMTCGLSRCAQLDQAHDTSGKSSGKNGEKENGYRHPNRQAKRADIKQPNSCNTNNEKGRTFKLKASSLE